MQDGETAIVRGSGRKLMVRRKKPRDFGPMRQKIFLRHFAATCNVKAAAQAAGISVTGVYNRRAQDPAFQEAWEAAQEQGYASLEAALIQRALEAATNVVPDEHALDDNYRISFKDALQLLQTQARGRGRKPGEQKPRRSDVAEATERLVKILKGLKIEPIQENVEGAEGE